MILRINFSSLERREEYCVTKCTYIHWTYILCTIGLRPYFAHTTNINNKIGIFKVRSIKNLIVWIVFTLARYLEWDKLRLWREWYSSNTLGQKKENQYSCHKGPVAICFGFRSSTATWDAGPTEHMGTVGTSKKMNQIARYPITFSLQHICSLLWACIFWNIWLLVPTNFEIVPPGLGWK